MKKVLIISPHFPPFNGADMHRTRQSLPYFAEWGWEATVVMVKPEKMEGESDQTLLDTIPRNTRIIQVDAFDYRYTRKIGLGSLALRSLPFYRSTVSRLLKNEQFDLIYFSTTQFPVMILGPYWKKKFKIPYIIDMQDPWHTDFYQDKPKSERPPKYWFSYRMNKVLEPIAMKKVDAIISVSEAYTLDLRKRYPQILPAMCSTITFGASPLDFELASAKAMNPFFSNNGEKKIHLVYTGVCNSAMLPVIELFLKAIKKILANHPEFRSIRMYFIGTSYAPNGPSGGVVLPLAKKWGLEEYVREQTARLGYFSSIKVQQEADLLLLLGTTDQGYTASKLYNYLAAEKPIFSIFHKDSSVNSIMKKVGLKPQVTFDSFPFSDQLEKQVYQKLWVTLKRLPYKPAIDQMAFEDYTARTMTRRQVAVFEKVISRQSQ